MKKARFYFAMAAAKLVRAALLLLRRNGSYMPGLVAVKICPDFIGYLTKPDVFIAVTGTNGKTTTSNLLTNILRANGRNVTNNSYGSNVQAGVAAALLANSSFGGTPKNDTAVLEVDERSSLLVYPYMAPDIIICNNIMRDSLKRNANTDFISYIINSALPQTSTLVLNGDDIICSRLGRNNKNRIFFGVDALRPEGMADSTVKDIVYCPECFSPLQAEYLRYNHIGRIRCPVCGCGTPERDFCVTDIDGVNNTFTVSHGGEKDTYRLINDNIVNVYNFCGAIAVLTRLGLKKDEIAKGFEGGEIVKTRYDSEQIKGKKLTMLLAKGQNPVACSRCYSYAASCPGENKTVIIMVDDKGDNTNSSESVSWLFDCDYTPLADESISEIIFSGPRCLDHVLRARLAGIDGSKIKTSNEFTGGAEIADLENGGDIFVLYDPYLLAEKDSVKNKLRQRAEAEL